jgi:adenosine deaminase
LERKATIHLPNGTEKELEMPLQHILLSNSFLLLYNLIEFTISNAIEAIYQEILDEGVSYNQIQPNIQIEIWDHVRKNVNTKRFIESLDDLVMDIVKHHPKSSDLFTGNVDQEAIKRLGQQYGFSVHTAI